MRSKTFLLLSALPLLLPACQSSTPVVPRTLTWAEPPWPNPPSDLLEKARWEYSVDGGKTYAPAVASTVKKDRTLRLTGRARFDYDHAEDVRALLLTCPVPRKFSGSAKLNAQSLKGPMKDMRYRSIPNISPGLLRPAGNEMTVSFEVASPVSAPNTFTPTPPVILLALEAEHLRFVSGPVLGSFDDKTFSVTCRTNLSADVAVCRRAGGGEEVVLARGGDVGLIHRLQAPIPARSDDRAQYFVRARLGRTTIRQPIVPPAPVGRTLRFVALGDSRTQPWFWAAVADAAARHNPQLVIHTGDMVSSGKEENAWEPEFFAPAAGLLASTPLYPVIGNHEGKAQLYNELFHTPTPDGRGRNWHQTIGPVLLIGIEGTQDWSAESENIQWLESVLAGSKAKFTFLVTHYPPASSSKHGRVESDGQLREKTMRHAREVIVPLLERAGATAVIAGHDHCYERSETPGGLTLVTTGGGGAPLYPQIKDPAAQNPWTRVFHKGYHYCLFEADSERCVLTVFDLDGKVLDARTWTTDR
ncbi:MAG: Calcineurin-like phosphoesterase [Planctomycetes bacterium ADurb.Bin126]|nr:MAG: Calcineurin-like phosphoesterase [Planctomycetes bacterium ADurb.Bin126]HOD81228.1 metallophosphoesterase [Phycisphaerae bacterium]HQL71792.1 metallophosphoesterase [Phycisphaerae bacterium]